MSAWVAPEPFYDTKENPWPDTTRVPLLDNNKVAFIDEGHQYFLQDGQWAYPDYIVSGSKITAYWDTYKKVECCGSYEDIDPVAQVYALMTAANGSYRRPITAAAMSIEGPKVQQIRSMIVSYINTFLDWGVADPSFTERAARLNSCAPDGASFPHHVRHRAMRAIEMWLLGEPFEAPAGWADLLRYIRCSTLEFSSVAAVGRNGCKLDELLASEWSRLNSGEEQLAPMCSTEASRLPFVVPSMAGSTAHKYMEHLLDPSRGILPELHEREDEECILEMFAYLRKKGITFDQGDIERRVGSLLYKFCGSMDGYRKVPGGEDEIWDWKRSSQVENWISLCNQPDPEDSHWLVMDFPRVTFTHALMKNSLQGASYRQLSMLSDSELKVRETAFLGVVHPSLARKFVIIAMPLNVKMQASALKTSKGIGNWTTKTGEVMTCDNGLTAIEYVKCFLHHRLEHLKRHFKCEPVLV